MTVSTPHECESDALRIVSALAELHVLARAFSESSTATEFGTTLRVAFVAEAASAWRLIETDRIPSGLRRVRMLCFGSFEEIKHAVQQRVDWAAADQQFRATRMATPAGFPGVTADWVHSKDFDAIFGPSRFALRAEICTRSSARTLVLR
jgi:hypothetical protein